MLNGKAVIILLSVGLMNKTYKYKWVFSKTEIFRGKLKVELDLSNYATKANLKNATGVDTSDFAKKTDLAYLKSNVGKLDIDSLKNVPYK